MIIIMVDLLLANKILYSTKLKKCKADYSSRLYQSLFPKKDKFSLPAVKLALTSTFMNWFICLSTTTTVNIGHEAVAIRSKLDLGFRCNETLICYWASSLIDAKFFVFFAGLCFHQKLFWYCPSCLLDGCIENSRLQSLLQTLVLHFQWRWVFCSSAHWRNCLHADRR